MAFNAKLPPGGLVAAAFGPKEQELIPTIEQPTRIGSRPVLLQRIDYDGADKSATNCPLARAIRRALDKGSDCYIAVWVGKVKVDDYCYALPDEATAADKMWTHSGQVTFLEFQLSNERVQP